ncbi:MAG: hypothetical protein GF331_14055 [Chitinivibrionales bacterium]|nr:hypothetical protein [Chitinivibrionales bacterium]
MYDPNDHRSLEKYSSAVTLSDMEVFIFPELIYALALANSMSPLVWSWRDDSWFKGREKMNEYRLLQRVKQFIMDNFTFNLDLDTWGLTTKERELARFGDFVDEQTLAQSNALFGYEGDKYYFDIDIRRHFGLDKYTSNVIPYWKTETVEAMHAFRYKEGYPSGAGECVSLATLYAAALFVLGAVPLERIYLMATPLHSQNFVDMRDGILTNNRRIVTKTMWYNGTELSSKARRALQNERVTVVAHRTGYVHTLYPQATMDRGAYEQFTERLHGFLRTDIDYGIITSFLRDRSSLQKCFQFSHRCCGKPRFIEAEKLFAYEHGSKSRVGDNTQASLIHEIDEDEFYPEPLENRILLDEIEAFFQERSVSVDSGCSVAQLRKYLHHSCLNVEQVLHDLIDFCRIEPRLPKADEREWTGGPAVEADGAASHEAIIEQLAEQRAENETVDLAFMAYRDMNRAPWKPFMKAALERNPVSVSGAAGLTPEQIAGKLDAMENYSIYDGARMAQPDEVWNFGRGDGLEKAICLLNILRAQLPGDSVMLDGDREEAVVRAAGREYRFASRKGLAPPPVDDYGQL